jgi:hypothetical protein
MGRVVVGGKSYQVTGLALRKGLLWITCDADGPVRAFTGPAAVFGSDGQGVCQGWECPMPEVPAGMHVQIVLPIRIATLENETARPEP